MSLEYLQGKYNYESIWVHARQNPVFVLSIVAWVYICAHAKEERSLPG